MATDFTRMFNRDGGPLMPTVAPPADYAPEQANPYLDLYNAAAGDPARQASIRAGAEAVGRPLPETTDPRSDAQRIYDGFWRATDTAQTGAGPDGYPAAVQPAQIDLWKRAGAGVDPLASDGETATKNLAEVETWLRSAASPEKAGELMALARQNAIVLRSLHTYSRAWNTYLAGRPK